MSFKRFVKPFVPPPVRAAIRRAFFPAPAQKPPIDLARYRPARSVGGKSIVVAGVYRSGTGLGRAAELVARTLAVRGATVTRVDVTADLGFHLRGADDFIRPAQCLAPDVTDLVLVLNPDNCHALHSFDLNWLLGRCVIGHWIWELERAPASWVKNVASFDRIWAPTDLVANSIEAGLPMLSGRIEVVPYAFEDDPMPHFSAAARQDCRDRLGLDRRAAVLGYAFSAGSNYYRKNPEAAVHVFKKVFASSATPGVLLLRSNDLHAFPRERERLLQTIAGDDRIRLHEHDSPISLHDFYAALDVLISPSRAEGFGLTLIEAAQAGVPVVTNGWRLPEAILRDPLIHAVGYDLVPVEEHQGHYREVADTLWAEPRMDEMSKAISTVLLQRLVSER
jgi:glycosyltransferase involved in cell wall biosynthesis